MKKLEHYHWQHFIFYYFTLFYFILLHFICFSCFDQIVEAVVNGVNVVIWFAVNLAVDKVTGLPIVQGTV
jgi:hypothetical protein